VRDLHAHLRRIEDATRPPPAPAVFTMYAKTGRPGMTAEQMEAWAAAVEADPEGDGSAEARVDAEVARVYRERGAAAAEGVCYWLATKGNPDDIGWSIDFLRSLEP